MWPEEFGVSMNTNLMPVGLLAPGSSLAAYMQTANTFPILSAEREKELAESLYFDNDLNAASEMVLSHLRFVVHIARSYSGYGLPLSDLVQEGNVGLMKAVRRFDPAKGVRLVSFAVHWIKAEMHEFILRNWRIVKVATTKSQRKLFFNLRSSKQRLGWLNSSEAKAIAEDLGVDVAEVRRMEGRLAAIDMAYDGAPDDGSENDISYAPAQYLEDQGADPAQQIEAADWEQSNNERLMTALDGLDDRSRGILQARWLQEEKSTLHELAAEYGVSAERIRQLEQNALKKLHGSLAA